MTKAPTAHPQIVSRQESLAARKAHLAHEKALTKQLDQLRAERRRLPMVKVDKRYEFDGPLGKSALPDLFADSFQLIVYHFMFDPDWEDGCPSCTGFVNALGDLTALAARGARFILVSRAPFAKLARYQARQKWQVPWYSSFDSDFNYDYHVSFDADVAPIEHNYRNTAELEARFGPQNLTGESQGLSVFVRLGQDVFHTYSTYARGVENLSNSFSLLDVTPFGRQLAFEDSPPGWPQRPTYG